MTQGLGIGIVVAVAVAVVGSTADVGIVAAAVDIGCFGPRI